MGEDDGGVLEVEHLTQQCLDEGRNEVVEAPAGLKGGLAELGIVYKRV